jgi:hypothetical protein
MHSPADAIAPRRPRGYIATRARRWYRGGGDGTVMRNEIQTVVEDIKRSVGLLRRHL